MLRRRQPFGRVTEPVPFVSTGVPVQRRMVQIVLDRRLERVKCNTELDHTTADPDYQPLTGFPVCNLSLHDLKSLLNRPDNDQHDNSQPLCLAE